MHGPNGTEQTILARVTGPKPSVAAQTGEVHAWQTPTVALFRKRDSGPAPSPIAAFWQWWATDGKHLDPSRMSKSVKELSRLVDAIHPDLAWHFGAGASAQHRLTVSAGGVAEVRPLAERWLRAAPPPDATWEFRASQQADPSSLDHTLQIAGTSLDLSATRFRVEPDADNLRIHVGVYHPAYRDVPQEVRAQVTYLVLDWLVGEDDVERWLGHVEALTEPPAPAASASEVSAAIAEIAAHVDPQEWAVARWEGEDGAPGLASFRRGVRWIDHPTLDRHQVVSVPYDARADGLPDDPASLDRLDQLESDLESLLTGRGLIVAHESHRGVRTFHAYTDGEDQNADAAVAEWAGRHGASVQAQPDPAWSQVRQFTG